MRKSKKVYMNYVCPHCWNTINKCKCKTYPPYHLIFIDENIQEHIRTLNEKGYRTIACCEGHTKVCISTYIAFANNYFDGISMPDGFRYNEKRRIVEHNYSTKIIKEKEKFEELKKANLKTLLEWCKNLPNRNV